MIQSIILRLEICLLTIPIIAFARWSSQQSGTTTQLMDVDFVNNNCGWVVGPGDVELGVPVILHTSDGGTNWINQTPSNIPGGIGALWSVSFVNANIGWAVGCDSFSCSLILKTTDGGASWFRQATPIDTPYVISVHFLDANNGWISHGSPYYEPNPRQVILHTTDGGNSFSIQGWNGYDGCIFRIFFSDLQHGWAAGGTEVTPTTKGYIMRTLNGGFGWLESYRWTPAVIGWPVMTGIHFPVDNTNGWACGAIAALDPASYEMRIIHTTDGGNQWTIQFHADTSVGAPWDIHFIDLQNGWTICAKGQILHTTDGGNFWQFDSSGVKTNLFGVDFGDINNGWAVGDNGVILKYTSVGIEDKRVAFAIDFDLFITTPKDKIVFLILSSESGVITISLYNTLGQKILSQKKYIPSGISQHNLSCGVALSNGVYFLKIEKSDRTVVKKFALIR